MLFMNYGVLNFRLDYGECLAVLQKMEQSEETKQLKFKTYLNLSSVARKIGDNYSCEKYIKHAEAMIHDLFDNDDLDGNPLLVSMIINIHTSVCI